MRALRQKGEQAGSVRPLSARHAYGLYGATAVQDAAQVGLLDVPAPHGELLHSAQSHRFCGEPIACSVYGCRAERNVPRWKVEFSVEEAQEEAVQG